MMSQLGQHAIIMHTLPNISQNKNSWAMKFTQLIEYNQINIFIQKSCTK